jgi:hypothetical protein
MEKKMITIQGARESSTPRISTSHNRASIFRKASLIALSLVLGATAVIAGRGSILPALGMHRPVSMLEHAGGVQLSAVNLKDHVPLPMHEGHTRYWLGPISGFTYTTNCATPGVLKVGYFKSGDLVREMPQAEIMISSFASEAIFDTHPRPLRIDPEIQILNAKGDLLTYRESEMRTFTIRQLGSDEILTITYSTPKSIQEMVRHSESLRIL